MLTTSLQTRTLDASNLDTSKLMPSNPSPTVISLLNSYRKAELSPVDALHARIEHIQSRNASLLALREVDAQGARMRVQQLQTQWEENREAAVARPLFGIPIAIKDNVAQVGKLNRAGRKDRAGHPAPSDAMIVQRLEKAGAIVLARANMDELAYGVSGSNPHTGQVRNARNPAFHPGGSSAGSATAVADGMVPLAIGTDTAGSVRIPASLCGVVGMRPTQGLVPSEGIAPLCPTLDTAGPIARTVQDVALLLSVLADLPRLASAVEDRNHELKTLHVLALEGPFAVDLDPAVRQRFELACQTMQGLIASMDSVPLDALVAGPRASGPIIGAEASFVWSKEFDAHPDWFGEEVAGHLSKGATIKAVRYLRAQEERASVVRDIDQAFNSADVLMLPTTASVATPAGAPGPQLRFLALTVPFSLGGYPAITVPMGELDGLPAGLQLVGKRGEDGVLLSLAAAFEAAFHS